MARFWRGLDGLRRSPGRWRQIVEGISLAAIRTAAAVFAERGWEHEIIVCDNNSTDRTGEIARAARARVVFEPVNQIARARNTGAGAASGDWLLFIDADSHPDPALFAEVADRIESGRRASGFPIYRRNLLAVCTKCDEDLVRAKALTPFYEGKPRLIRDEAMRSTGFAGMALMLAARGMGYDSCPMVGFDAEAVAKLIRPPEDHALSFMLVIGKQVSGLATWRAPARQRSNYPRPLPRLS